MTTWYVDTSAVAKLLRPEPESAAFAETLDSRGIALVSGAVLITEIRRFAHRLDIRQERVTALLDRIDILEAPLSLFVAAGIAPGRHLRSLDALHLVGCIESGADALATYDARLARAAADVGVRVVAPGTAGLATRDGDAAGATPR